LQHYGIREATRRDHERQIRDDLAREMRRSQRPPALQRS
jgi:hypothetical protein